MLTQTIVADIDCNKNEGASRIQLRQLCDSNKLNQHQKLWKNELTKYN